MAMNVVDDRIDGSAMQAGGLERGDRSCSII
jgi:hypothetical protein